MDVSQVLLHSHSSSRIYRIHNTFFSLHLFVIIYHKWKSNSLSQFHDLSLKVCSNPDNSRSSSFHQSTYRFNSISSKKKMRYFGFREKQTNWECRSWIKTKQQKATLKSHICFQERPRRHNIPCHVTRKNKPRSWLAVRHLLWNPWLSGS